MNRLSRSSSAVESLVKAYGDRVLKVDATEPVQKIVESVVFSIERHS